MDKCCGVVIIGKVQDVGFRNQIENFGRGFNIRGQVQNEKNGTVKILCGGKNDSVDNFLQVIKKVVPDDGVVENWELSFDIYDNLPYPFGRVHTDDEEDVGRKLDIGNDLLRSIKGNTSGIKTGINNLNTKFDSLNKNIDSFIIEQTEHNAHLEAILEKLSEKSD